MFDVRVSTYQNYKTSPMAIPLKQWIRSTMNPDCKYASRVQQYRSTGDKQIKKWLPCVTVSALCDEGHKKTDVVRRTGWIALDIDHKDNPHLADAEKLRDEIAKISFVAYAGLSVSGKGVWALVKVKQPQKQHLYFRQLQADFKHLGIILDSSKGANANDLRFYSYDPDAYVANEFGVYDRLPIQSPPNEEVPASQGQKVCKYSTWERVEALVSQIEARRIDITDGYKNWRNLGFALEDEFKEGGRKYFHRISQFHPEYDRRACDDQFTYCLENDGYGIRIGTFFHVCRAHGVTLVQEDAVLHGDNSDAPHGYNPFTSEIFDERGYPADWDMITANQVPELKQQQLN